MKSLIQTYEGVVDASEIDDLGHMNVRHYGARALASTATLLGAHALGPEACEAIGASLEPRDLYTRHFREQMVDAPLVVRSGVLAVDEDEVRLYHELRNPARDELAASFVHRFGLRCRESRETLPLPEEARKTLHEALARWPEHGRPRSIDLERALAPLSLAEARSRGLALRKERRIGAADCDGTGSVPASKRQELVWGGEPIHGGVAGPPMMTLDDGQRMSFAALETRSILGEPPREGTRIQSFSAIVEIGAKTMMRRTWVFDLDSERLVQSSVFVDIALHLGLRRAIEIPPRLRADFEAKAQLDLL